MTEDHADPDRPKKDRSPSFPFIPLRRAVERAEQFQQAHKRDAARLISVATTWGYGPKSSGLLQTVAALKQYGLLEDHGTGDDRKLRLSDLARSIISDTRPGVKEKALDTAARNPKLFAEYIEKWVPDSPSDNHCVSELEHDRGFNPDGAKTFLKAFKQTVSFAGLQAHDNLSGNSDQSEEQENPNMEAHLPPLPQPPTPKAHIPVDLDVNLPLRQRYQVTMSDDKLVITATLVTPQEVDKLIRVLRANKAVMGDAEGDDEDED